MQFGREPLIQTLSTDPVDGERGWICTVERGHFLRWPPLSAATTTVASGRAGA